MPGSTPKRPTRKPRPRSSATFLGMETLAQVLSDNGKGHYWNAGTNPPKTLCGKDAGQTAEDVTCIRCQAAAHLHR